MVAVAPSSTALSVSGIFNITLGALPGSIVQGDNWSFVTYPYNTDIELDDLTIPIIKPGDFTLDIEQTFN